MNFEMNRPQVTIAEHQKACHDVIKMRVKILDSKIFRMADVSNLKINKRSNVERSNFRSKSVYIKWRI